MIADSGLTKVSVPNTERHRIVMIFPWLSMGGADKFNLELVAKLTEYGWMVSIVTTLKSENPWYSQFKRYTSDISHLYSLGGVRDYPGILIDFIKMRNADVVLISNSELGYELLPYLRFHLPEVTFIDYCHMEEEYWRKGGFPRYSCNYQPYLDLSIVASRHLKEWMIAHGASRDRVEVAYINVDADFWRSDREVRSSIRCEMNISDNLPVILYAGRLCEQKQPEVFGRVILELKKKGSCFKAIVAGSGEDEAWLKQFIEEHGLQNEVLMIGAVSLERMRELMLASDIFFLPSLWEGIAMTFYEAMSCGLVIIGADVGGQRELVVDGTGILIKPGSIEEQVKEYSDILFQIIKNEELRKRIGANARQRILDNFRLEEMGKRMACLINKAVSLHIQQTKPVVTGKDALKSCQLAIIHIFIADIVRIIKSLLPPRLKKYFKKYRKGII